MKKQFFEIAKPTDLNLVAKSEPIQGNGCCYPQRAIGRMLPYPRDCISPNAMYRRSIQIGDIPPIDEELCLCENRDEDVGDLTKSFEVVQHTFVLFDIQVPPNLWKQCQAIDSHNSLKIRCKLNDHPTVICRPNKKVPFRAFCNWHFSRFKAHECCPTCGTFCLAGVFNVCSAGEGKPLHLFHVGCENFLGHCPHCGAEEYKRLWVEID